MNFFLKKIFVFLFSDFRKKYQIIVCAVLLNIFLGCTPSFNWRILHNVNDNFEAIFPGRIHQRKSNIEIEKKVLPIHIYFSKFGTSVFAVNVIKFPSSLHYLQHKSLSLLIKNFAGKTKCFSLLLDNKLEIKRVENNNLKLALPFLESKQLGLANCQKLVLNEVGFVNQIKNSRIIFDKAYYGIYQYSKDEQQTLWYVRFIADKNYIYQLTALTQFKNNYSIDRTTFFNEAVIKFFNSFRYHVFAEK